MTALAVLLPNGMQQFVDGNGAPYANGSVYFYVPGTTTLKNTWADPLQLTLNPNPVPLDGNGRAIIYGIGQYQQVLYNAVGVEVWSQLTAAPGTTASGPTQVTLTASSGTYTPPSLAVRISVELVGAGGGASGSGTGDATSGTDGTASTFGGIAAAPGKAGQNSGMGGAGGTGGAGLASYRAAGTQGGNATSVAAGGNGVPGGFGAPSFFGGGVQQGVTPQANMGAGGAGGGGSATNVIGGGGGGSGEYVRLLVNNLASSYAYVVGLGGTGGAAGTSGVVGTNGSNGVILVTEFYQ